MAPLHAMGITSRSLPGTPCRPEESLSGLSGLSVSPVMKGEDARAGLLASTDTIAEALPGGSLTSAASNSAVHAPTNSPSRICLCLKRLNPNMLL